MTDHLCDSAGCALGVCLRGLDKGSLRALGWIADRLRRGFEQYGPLDIEGDMRDWDREANEEAADYLVYKACADLRRRSR